MNIEINTSKAMEELIINVDTWPTKDILIPMDDETFQTNVYQELFQYVGKAYFYRPKDCFIASCIFESPIVPVSKLNNETWVKFNNYVRQYLRDNSEEILKEYAKTNTGDMVLRKKFKFTIDL